MKGVARVLKLIRTDREWAILAACFLATAGSGAYVVAMQGGVAVLIFGLGIFVGSLATGIINQMGRWS
jgi:hypothetical protein